MILGWLRRRLPDWVPLWFIHVVFTIDDVSWWFIHRFNRHHHYHIIRTGLKPGYYDTDDLLEAAIITLLYRFVEEERDGPGEIKAAIVAFTEMLEPDECVRRKRIESPVAADRPLV